MLILLSPSKTQESGVSAGKSTAPLFLEKTEQIVEELKRLTEKQIAELMSISDKLAHSTYNRFQEFTFPVDEGKCRQALLAFRGDVFTEIKADTYSADDFLFAQDHLRILSGLYGALRPLDLIQPYRLEMGSKYLYQNSRTLYQFWKEDVTAHLNECAGKSGHTHILNLASQEYFKVVNRKKLHSQVVEVAFKQRKGDKLRTVAIHAKKARGAMTQFTIEKRLHDPDGLVDFSYDGYVFDKDHSTTNNLIYIRKE